MFEILDYRSIYRPSGNGKRFHFRAYERYPQTRHTGQTERSSIEIQGSGGVALKFKKAVHLSRRFPVGQRGRKMRLRCVLNGPRDSVSDNERHAGGFAQRGHFFRPEQAACFHDLDLDDVSRAHPDGPLGILERPDGFVRDDRVSMAWQMRAMFSKSHPATGCSIVSMPYRSSRRI